MSPVSDDYDIEWAHSKLKMEKKYTAKVTNNEFPHRVCVFTCTHMWQSEDNLREPTPS